MTKSAKKNNAAKEARNLRLANAAIARMRKNGHQMTDRQTKEYAARVARLMNADDE